MTSQSAFVRNLWGLTVLCLLREQPTHPYELRRLIRERNKGEFLDLKAGSLYHAVTRLQRAGFIKAHETSREGKRPERTVYELTAAGERELIDWLGELLSKPATDERAFYAALSFLSHLTPPAMIEHLENRASQLQATVTSLQIVMDTVAPQIGRVLLLEVEYALSARRSELAWVRGIVEELRTGKLIWVCPWAKENERPSKIAPSSDAAVPRSRQPMINRKKRGS